MPFDAGFDEYYNGPTLAALDPFPEQLEEYIKPSIFHFASRSTIKPWETFYDRGWRLLPSFSQAFYLQAPFQVQEHLMPHYPLPASPDCAHTT